MPAAESVDVFIHNRPAVLDALLSDPELGGTGAAKVAPASHSVAAGPPRLDVGENGEPAESFGGLDEPDFDPPDRATAAKVKASERILALLNGQTAGVPPPDFATRLPDRGELNREEPVQQPTAQPRFPRLDLKTSGDQIRYLLNMARNPKAALVIGGLLVMILILALIFGGRDEKSDRRVYATVAPSQAVTTAPTTVTTAASGTLRVRSALAHCPPGGTPGSDAFAGPGKAWTCARAYRVDGQVLTIDLGRAYQIESIGLVPGFDGVGADGVDQWSKYRTASRVSYQFDDPAAKTYTQETLDQRTLVVTKISPPVSASRILLTVLESKGDSSSNSIALSSIVITGH